MLISVRVRPGASRTRVGGRYGEDEVLCVAVTARAVDGAATDAVCRAVAEAFGAKPRQVRLRSGQRSRTKVLEVDVEEESGRRTLAALLADQKT